MKIELLKNSDTWIILIVGTDAYTVPNYHFIRKKNAMEITRRLPEAYYIDIIELLQ